MSDTDNDAYLAGRLIQWGLRVKAVPFHDEEYRELLDRFIDQPAFRTLVRQIASGLGLTVLEATGRGLFLGPDDDSVFRQKPSDFRGATTAEDRLLDGLVQIAIAATIYPRQQDLDEDTIEAKPPITVVEVDETLRALCVEHKRRALGDPDADSSAVEQGLQEAWRVYESRPSLKTTETGKVSRSSTQFLIRRHLHSLVDHGCFVVSKRDTTESYRPTLRYQVQVKELAASKLYNRLQSLLSDATNNSASDFVSDETIAAAAVAEIEGAADA